jgi:hypothetical protein
MIRQLIYQNKEYSKIAAAKRKMNEVLGTLKKDGVNTILLRAQLSPRSE